MGNRFESPLMSLASPGNITEVATIRQGCRDREEQQIQLGLDGRIYQWFIKLCYIFLVTLL